jgi:pyruvoyl-dependent arginine decarboxylase
MFLRKEGTDERLSLAANAGLLHQRVGTHKEELRSFEAALRDAGIEKYNLVHVSSILPPRCKIIPKSEGLKELKPGQIVFCVMARCSSNEPHRLIAASIGCAVPADPDAYGYLSEHHAYGQNRATRRKQRSSTATAGRRWWPRRSFSSERLTEPDRSINI